MSSLLMLESGVQYTHTKPDEEQLGFTEFTYTGWHQPTNSRYVHVVWVIGGRRHMLELINYWNGKDPMRWHYIL